MGVEVDEGETIFTEDEDGIWVRGWMLVMMEEQLNHFIMNGHHTPDFYVEPGETEVFVGTKGLWTGTWIRSWMRVPVDNGDMSDAED